MTDELVVDVRGRDIATLDDFWDAVTEPLELPDWFGRNLDAWWDAVETRGVSHRIDAYPIVVVQASAQGLFAPGSVAGERLAALFAEATRARLELT
ncbi:barstar family protein [Streptomyces sp. TP-A0874]|uniref:barstar family protein n=1 Tax=Streptomyces sp. TP-A0874 TaxID=549819 RepID=UPI000853D860|nr:barstar family protein [Streptomyces sp. TP-A0874]